LSRDLSAEYFLHEFEDLDFIGSKIVFCLSK
jgi:hypothetical protein